MAHPVFVHITANEHGIFERIVLHRLRHLLARRRIAIPTVIPQGVTRTNPKIATAKNGLLRHHIPRSRVFLGVGKGLI